MENKQIDQMVPLVISLVSIGIVLVVAFRVFSTAKAQETAGTAAYNAIGDVEDSTQDIVDWLPIVVIAVIGFLVLGIIAFRR